MKLYLGIMIFQFGLSDDAWWFDLFKVTTKENGRSLIGVFHNTEQTEIELLFFQFQIT